MMTSPCSNHTIIRLALGAAALATPTLAFAADPYVLVGDQTPPEGFEYTSAQPAIATASSTCPDWSCGSDRSADNAIDGVDDYGWNAGYAGPAWMAVIFDAPRTMSGIHIDGEVQPYPLLTVAEAPTVTQIYSLDVVTSDGAHHTYELTWTMVRKETTPGYFTVNGRDFEFGGSLDVTAITITVTNLDAFPYDSWPAIDNVTLITAAPAPDTDGDGVDDSIDDCPADDAREDDIDGDGCIDGLIGHWTFSDGYELEDLTGHFGDIVLHGDASVADGELDVNGVAATSGDPNASTGWARTGAYHGDTVSDKTLVSWVRIDDLTVQSGSALTLDSISKDSFDAIVYGERQAGRWMSGSSGYLRTRDASQVVETSTDVVQMSISYESLGGGIEQITLCRDGVVLGSYTTANATTWTDGDTEAIFGKRHYLDSLGGGPGTLDAHIDEARIYDSALVCGVGVLAPPPVVDSDGDGVDDDLDLCPTEDASGYDADADGCVDDTDDDGIGDDTDLCLDEDASGYDADADGCVDDTDDDGHPDDVDNCPATINPDQYDDDGDGEGDACDLDIDGDGFENSIDICPGFDDDGPDADGDLVPNACDACATDPNNDKDGDALCDDGSDPCPDDYSDGNGSDDMDGDLVCNSDDVCNETSEAWLGEGSDDLVDVDTDGIPDDCDVCVDANGDAICTTEDSCFYAGLGGDADVDALCDADDDCPLDFYNDSDDDGSCGDVDICPGFDDFADTDLDALPDCKDACPSDRENDGDRDGFCESSDNCPGTANPDQVDADNDGVGNACEVDSDKDGIVDDYDNCDFAANASQADADNDGTGDACDADDDNDGVKDAKDSCPATPSGSAVLKNGCSVPQTCSPTARWKNHGAYVECVEDASDALYRAGTITRAQRNALQTAAAQSNIGKSKKDRDTDHHKHGHHGDNCRD